MLLLFSILIESFEHVVESFVVLVWCCNNSCKSCEKDGGDVSGFCCGWSVLRIQLWPGNLSELDDEVEEDEEEEDKNEDGVCISSWLLLHLE